MDTQHHKSTVDTASAVPQVIDAKADFIAKFMADEFTKIQAVLSGFNPIVINDQTANNLIDVNDPMALDIPTGVRDDSSSPASRLFEFKEKVDELYTLEREKKIVLGPTDSQLYAIAPEYLKELEQKAGKLYEYLQLKSEILHLLPQLGGIENPVYDNQIIVYVNQIIDLINYIKEVTATPSLASSAFSSDPDLEGKKLAGIALKIIAVENPDPKLVEASRKEQVANRLLEFIEQRAEVGANLPEDIRSEFVRGMRKKLHER